MEWQNKEALVLKHNTADSLVPQNCFPRCQNNSFSTLFFFFFCWPTARYLRGENLEFHRQSFNEPNFPAPPVSLQLCWGGCDLHCCSPSLQVPDFNLSHSAPLGAVTSLNLQLTASPTCFTIVDLHFSLFYGRLPRWLSGYKKQTNKPACQSRSHGFDP